ncbi:hypothetical protein [Streptomyces megasporus]|uniref:hypothetical protein n=1 Tax=Streptomyces megasporus TaxID=44060 RepID=UPI00068D69FC|nr:hypothetical protein [Streptomyces megasporus]
MGKASRRKKGRTRQEVRQWDATAAARAALHDRTVTLLRLEDNPYVAACLAATTDRNFQHALWHHIRAGLSLGQAWQETAAWMLGEAGYPGPWPHGTQLIADYAVWERQRQIALLRHAEICVVSPAAHAAVMAAAMTLDATDLLTLDRDTDIPLRAGLVVMPEPVVLLNRNADLGDLSVLGWTFGTMYGSAGEEHPAVGVSGMVRTDGPTKTSEWAQFLAETRAGGHPAPPWFPAGTNGIRADAATRSTSSHTEAVVSLQARRMLHTAVGDLVRTNQRPAPHAAQWNGEPIEDPYNDFAERYLFAFWRLAAQGVTTATGATPPGTSDRHRPAAENPTRDQAPGAIRLIDLRRTSDRAARTGQPPGPSRYHHRWPVRMHKVNQWYPSLGRHKIRWRGPFIKGPADAPLRITEKAYHLST